MEEMKSQKPGDQLTTILCELPDLSPLIDDLSVILVTYRNLQKDPNNPKKVFRVLKVMNGWGKPEIEGACKAVAQALEEAGAELGSVFFGETSEGQPNEGDFGKEVVERRFDEELGQQESFSQRAAKLLQTVSSIALALNLADPTQTPPAPPPQPPQSRLLARLVRPVTKIKIPSIFQEEKPLPEEIPPSWTTPPVWGKDEEGDFELLETIGEVVLDENVQDKWETLRSYRDWMREEVEDLLKRVNESASKQHTQSRSIVENVTDSRNQFLSVLEMLLWIKSVSNSVLSSLSSAA